MSGVYGASLYGTGLYTAPPVITWSVLVKWDGTNEIDEAGALMELSMTRGRKHLVRGADGFEPMGVGETTLVLRNHDGRYDPLNSSSDIYPNVEPGKEVRIRVTGADGTTYNMFRGHLYDIKPLEGKGVKRVRFVIRDGWQWLKDRKVRAATQLSYRTDQALNALKSAAGYPFATSLYIGTDTIPYWWGTDADAMSQMQSVVDSEFGLIWIAADGTLTFRRRPYQWMLSASHTLTGTNINEINFAQPWEVVRNVIQVRAYPTEVRTKQVLWRSEAPIKVRAGKTITLNVEYNLQTTQDQTGVAINVRAVAASLETLVPSGDWVAYANENGTGDNLNAFATLTATNKGDSAQIVITNSGTRALFILGLKLRGALLIKNNVVTVEEDVSGTEPERSLLVNVPWQQDIDKAQRYAEYLADFFTDPRAAPVVRTNIAGLAIQCAELFTGMQINIAALGLSNKLYRLCGVTHHWDAISRNVMDTRFYLERNDDNTYFTLNSSELNGAHVLAY